MGGRWAWRRTGVCVRGKPKLVRGLPLSCTPVPNRPCLGLAAIVLFSSPPPPSPQPTVTHKLGCRNLTWSHASRIRVRRGFWVLAIPTFAPPYHSVLGRSSSSQLGKNHSVGDLASGIKAWYQ